MPKAMCMDVYLLLDCNDVYSVLFLGLKQQIGKLTCVFICQFVQNHNQRKDKDAHRYT